MRLVKFQTGSLAPRVGVWEDERIVQLDLDGSPFSSLNDILESNDPGRQAGQLRNESLSHDSSAIQLLPPIDEQEVWAAGVTYKRSQTARMQESEAAADCYDRVYGSDRPELFFKATPHRVGGPGQPLRIRVDSQWNVPEPELTLVINSRRELIGFTVGNDMSSRDIEGENPLYLPQAKLYDDCCGLGPCITLASAMPARDEIGIQLRIERADETVFEGRTSIAQMARSFDDLIGYLGRDNSFPRGVFLLTGTGIVPDNDFTLLAGDVVHISIDGIGTLTNPIIQG